MGYLVLDIGGSSVKYAFANKEGILSFKGSIPTCKDNIDCFLESIAEIYRKCKWEKEIEGIAVSAPGAVDSCTGVIHGLSAVPCIHEIPFAKMLSNQMDGVVVSVENDGNCGALGEAWMGAAKGVESAAMIVCGSGIGGGYVKNGQIHRGSHFSASEFGFMPIAFENGESRPWSDFSVVNTVNRYNRERKTSITGQELFDRAARDKIAAQYIERFYHYLAIGCLSVAFALDPDVIVIGGAVSARNDFTRCFLDSYSEIVSKNKMFTECHAKIAVSELGNDANLYGALRHHLYAEKFGGTLIQ